MTWAPLFLSGPDGSSSAKPHGYIAKIDNEDLSLRKYYYTS